MNKGIRFTDEFKRDAVAQVITHALGHPCLGCAS
jgi:transposase-like protein